MAPHYVGIATEAVCREVLEPLRALAEEMNVLILVLTDLVSDIDQGEDKRPRLSDLPCRVMQQLATQVWFLYRDDFYDAQCDGLGLAEINVARNTMGPTGWVRMRFLGEGLRFEKFYVEDGSS